GFASSYRNMKGFNIKQLFKRARGHILKVPLLLFAFAQCQALYQCMDCRGHRTGRTPSRIKNYRLFSAAHRPAELADA
ncbi:hypothetical protein, partial [Pseudomonas kilonensis]|uniref:hypothetical protein n=1 Tax=Pseudomonas kilonensis TaxID=132476 RepID=UPI001C8F2743